MEFSNIPLPDQGSDYVGVVITVIITEVNTDDFTYFSECRTLIQK